MHVEHRKNENTGIIHRALIHRLSEAMIDGEHGDGSRTMRLISRYFSPGTPLAGELALHRAISEARGVPESVARRVVADVLRGSMALDHRSIRIERRKLLGEMARVHADPLSGCESWEDYRALAAIGALIASAARGSISESLGRARLEEDIVRWMTAPAPAPRPVDPDRSPLAFRLALKSLAADVSNLPVESQRLIDALVVGEASGDLTRYRRLAEGEHAESLATLREFKTDDEELAQRMALVIGEVERIDVGSTDSARTLIEARLIAQEVSR